jgi:hypothetical protein
MDAFLDAVCVRVCVQTTIALDWPLAAPWDSLSSKGSAVLNRSSFLLSTGCAFILSSTIQNNLVGSVQYNRWNKLTAWMWRIVRLFYSNIYIIHDGRSNHDDDIYMCTSAVCVIGVSAKSRYFADPQTKRNIDLWNSAVRPAGGGAFQGVSVNAKTNVNTPGKPTWLWSSVALWFESGSKRESWGNITSNFVSSIAAVCLGRMCL